MNVLVTGGAGFIGSNLVDQLVKLGLKVTVIDNLITGRKSNLNHLKNKIRFVQLDISKDNISRFFLNIDWVYHLAGLADVVPSITNPKDYFNCNVLGTLNVLEASKINNVKKFIYAASASCYGIPKKYPTSETAILDPKYPYALTKYLGEQLVLHWSKIYKMHCISMRFFNVYGPRSRTTGAYGAVFGVFLRQKLAKKPLTIVGNGEQTRDFIHVYDLVDGLIKVAKLGKASEVYNIAGGKEISVNTIADLISPKRIYVPKRPGEPSRSLANITKIKKKIKWKPKISIQMGVKMLLENINDWKDAPVWNKKKIKEATKVWFQYLS